MDAVEYLETKVRMLESDKNEMLACKIECECCKFNQASIECGCECTDIEYMYPKKSVEIVEKWRNEHTEKTLKDKMLEILPNVRVNIHGVPDLCPQSLGLLSYGVCKTNCTDCWNSPYKEV